MSSVVTSVDGAVASVILNRPEARNALSGALCDEIVVALGDVLDDEDVRVIVLAGEGPAFCAGADLADVSGAQGVDFVPRFERMLQAVADLPLPTIARIHGAALGGGLQLATVCDFRIAASDARIGIPSARLGVVVNLENVQRLVALVGPARAKEVLMTARVFNGEEAERVGLVSRSVPPSALESVVRGRAADLASLAPLSVHGAKRSINIVAAACRVTQQEAAEVQSLVEGAYRSADLKEGIAAAGEKRDPMFRGS